MLARKFLNVAGSSITVTSVATKLTDLINTAGGTTANNAGFGHDVNAYDLRANDGDIRIFENGQDPTASHGMLLKNGDTWHGRNVGIEGIRLIRAGSSNVSCSIQIGTCNPHESSSYSQGSTNVTLETGDLEIGAVEIKNATTDTRAIVDSNGRLAVMNFGQLVPKEYDYISLGYTGSNLTTVVYKTGGSGGTTQATLTLGYSGSTLTSVTKS